ncbi:MULTISPECIES: CynX/NimT family MFS transporter [Streptomyces violaceusniger group]|uniref:CynX/NimT family MFS transporter n=1 Tax=Streptomyces rhizosphaericus TaxID=114699 RepID=A0ABN1PXY6_9ACTN|nr:MULTISPECIES: MFS transporter [Streptomyces violaceusniger group]
MPRPHTPGPEAEPLLVDAETDLRPTPEVTAARRTLRAHSALLLIGIVLASLNMRAALAGVSPLLGEISGHFGLSATTGSLVTTIPLIFMGLASPFAPRLARRWGTEAVLLSALVLLLGGILLRVAPPVMALFAGGALVGSGIAFLNVLMPGLVKRDFPHRAAGMTALYTTSMIGGATVSAASAVPLENALGGWRGSLASWSLLAAVAALVWIPQTVLARRGTHHGEPAATPVRTTSGAEPRLGRSALAWQVTLFMGLQSSIAYVCIAWMPTIFTDHGMSKSAAGLVFAFSTMLQMVGSFVVPTLAGRMRSQRTLAVAVAALMGAGIAGLLAAPAAGAWVWAALIGVGQGGSVGLALTMMVLRTGDAHTSARLSGMAQTWGYLLAAVGPLALGVVHQTTGGWALPLTLMLAVCGALALLGLGAGRDRRIRA